MKLLLHDYSGHAFTAQLGRALACRGIEVVYASFEGFATPKGRVAGMVGDPASFRAVQIGISEEFDKDNLLKRHRQQLEYARRIRALVLAERPDVVLSANAPIEVQEHLLTACRTLGAAFVFWVQDIHAEAIERIIGKKNDVLGRLVGAYYRRKEARVLRDSDGVVVIAEAFRDVLAGPRWGLDVSHMVVIENWANIADMPSLPRDNVWVQENMREGRHRVVYSGTLARKHNPGLLLELARKLDADVYLFSQGSGADLVRDAASAEGLDNVIVRPWVSVEDLPSMLAGADIALAIIEADAGVFSVPSKVLSYLAAGQPILASIPEQNLAAVTVAREGAGLVAAPGDIEALVQYARALLEQPELRARMGRAGRAYAEKAFDIDLISARFELILRNASPTPQAKTAPIFSPQDSAGVGEPV
ncbi:MAG: glycosyltransferase family 4 protein [Devosia sp.]|uniref:glycosyltransferase family 4 protein n=1 Tax=Devosia sp. TaxID=1871048 RepID=UPI002604B6BE|nr:glycosyltransferase family 4 protein [Devosia sp.]MDB5586551.1 glycosyltransferase family 4 protein [Devosia sp.]